MKSTRNYGKFLIPLVKNATAGSSRWPVLSAGRHARRLGIETGGIGSANRRGASNAPLDSHYRFLPPLVRAIDASFPRETKRGPRMTTATLITGNGARIVGDLISSVNGTKDAKTSTSLNVPLDARANHPDASLFLTHTASSSSLSARYIERKREQAECPPISPRDSPTQLLALLPAFSRFGREITTFPVAGK